MSDVIVTTEVSEASEQELMLAKAAQFAEVSEAARAALKVAVRLAPGKVTMALYSDDFDRGRLYPAAEAPSHKDVIVRKRAAFLRYGAGLSHHQVRNALGLHGPRLSAATAKAGLKELGLTEAEVASQWASATSTSAA